MALAAYAAYVLDARMLIGKLLVASPILVDPNFARTVVLVCKHDATGAVGLVLNRPLVTPVGPHIREWGLRLADPDVVFAGGPVEPDAALVLWAARRPFAADASAGEQWLMQPLPGLFVTNLDLLDEAAADSSLSVERARIFSGYAGWGAGQLESELLDEGWFVVDAAGGDAFVADATSMWAAVLRRQRNELSMFATFPDDPTRN